MNVPTYYNRWGSSWRMRVVITDNGVFMSGWDVCAYVTRVSDGAMFNFYEYEQNPTSSLCWSQMGSFPSDLTRLRTKLTEFQVGSVSLYYNFEWNFPNNDSENTNVENYQIFYYNPSGLQNIGTENVTFCPSTVSFSTYEAKPVTQMDLTTIIS